MYLFGYLVSVSSQVKVNYPYRLNHQEQNLDLDILIHPLSQSRLISGNNINKKYKETEIQWK